MSLLFTSPLEWWLDLSAEQIAQSRYQSRQTATPLSQHQHFLNHLCVQVMVPWLKTEYDADAVIWPQPETLSSLWDVVDGVAIALNDVRVLLVPSETIDTDGCSVPQEWVDIPSWAADYYIAVQVNLDQSYVRAWGYISHAQLKHKGIYDTTDRTYDIRRECLGLDFNAFWVICQHCPETLDREAIGAGRRQADISSDSSLSESKGNHSESSGDHPETLIQQLMQYAFPRLAMPVEQWNWLVTKDGWRQRFYEQRLFAMNQSLVPAFANDLEHWAAPYPIHDWQVVGATDDMGRSVTGDAMTDAVRNREIRPFALSLRKEDEGSGSTPQRSKRICFPTQPNPLSVQLLMSVCPTSEDTTEVVIQAHPLPGEDYVPANLILELRDGLNQVLRKIQARDRDNFIQFPQFTCPVGTRFSLHLCFEEYRMIEHFITGNHA